MRLFLLVLAATLTAAPLAAQGPSPSTAGDTASSAEDAAPELPVSLDRIREGLAQAPAKPLLDALERTPDFMVQIEERRTIEEILAPLLDLKSGPAPPGGLYAYEQQRRLFNPVDRPLAQPYAAFSGAELITIAIQNLVARYLGGRLLDAVTNAERARAERAARDEVSQAIADYCALRSDRGESLAICKR